MVEPSSLPAIVHDTYVKILEVSLTDSLSAPDRVRGFISNSAQNLDALRVLRAHGIALQCKPSSDHRSQAVVRV